MPTVLISKDLRFMIHTRDHGHPHVTVYKGTPESYEAKAKIRLDVLEVIESEFSQQATAIIMRIVSQYQSNFLEVWNDSREG